MKKLLLIQIVFLSCLIAKEGFERVVDKNQMTACKMAKDKAYSEFEIFRINSECICKKTKSEEWACDLYFNYIRKK